MKYLLYIIVAASLMLSCDKIKEPYIENNGNNDDSDDVVQKVLIEDFTGHMCGNCPRAHEELQSLHATYGDKIIAIGIHSGVFASTNTSYPVDYRTTEGNELTSYFGVTQYPTGMVNRIEESGQKLIEWGNWGTIVSTILAQEPEIGIEITNNYNSVTRQLQSSAKIDFLADQAEQLKICFVITEDSIVSPQTDYNASPTKIDNYVHRHVFRAAMNGTFGENLSSATFANGASVTVNKSTTLNNAWDASHCYVIVYVYRESDEKIIQVEEKKAE